MQKYKLNKQNIGFLISSILFLIASFIDGEFNKQFFSVFLLFLVIFFVNFYRENNVKPY